MSHAHTFTTNDSVAAFPQLCQSLRRKRQVYTAAFSKRPVPSFSLNDSVNGPLMGYSDLICSPVAAAKSVSPLFLPPTRPSPSICLLAVQLSIACSTGSNESEKNHCCNQGEILSFSLSLSQLLQNAQIDDTTIYASSASIYNDKLQTCRVAIEQTLGLIFPFIPKVKR
jgi:hypothetical protein